MCGPTCIFWANLTPFSLQCTDASDPLFLKPGNHFSHFLRLRDGRLLMTWTHRSNAIDDDGFGTGSRALLSDDELTFDFDSDYIVISAAESDDYCCLSGDTPWCCAPAKGGCNCFAGYGNTVQLPDGVLVTATFRVLVNGSSFADDHQYQTVITRWQLPPRAKVAE